MKSVQTFPNLIRVTMSLHSVPLGAYAQQRIIPANIAVKVPDGISHELAATLMTKGLTTNYLLTKTYKLKAGETVLFMRQLEE